MGGGLAQHWFHVGDVGQDLGRRLGARVVGRDHDASGQARRDALEQLVASDMAEAVIDELEVVQVDEDDRGGPVVAQRAGEALDTEPLGATLHTLLAAGAAVPVTDVFAVGQKVDVQGTSIGKGYAGTIKRHNFKSQRASHGNSRSHNVPGSISMAQDPGRVFPGKKMSGHMGAVQQSTQNLEVVKVDVERGLIAIRGAVPGAAGGDVIVRPASKGA